MRYSQQNRLMMVTVACLLGACKADFPALDNDADFADASCQTGADLLINFVDSAGQDATVRADVVLRDPDNQSIEVAPDGVLSVGFIAIAGVLNSRDRDDIRVHAVGSDDVEVAAYAGFELGRMHYIGTLTQNDLEVDLACGSVSAALYVQLIGLRGTLVVDSFEALRAGCDSTLDDAVPSCP